MKVNKKTLIFVSTAVLLAAVISGSYFFSRASVIPVPVFFQPAGNRLLISMDGFRFAKSENGIVSWRMHARNADLYENKEAQLQEIEILFKSADRDAKEATILGDRGTMDTSNGNASLHKGAQQVRVATSDGYILTTNSLFWKAGERLVWTADPFKLLGKEIYLEGTGISANVDMRIMTVKDNVKAVLQE
ncbi:MAG: LPS export ABC transporter periplasmic protein LptC [Nitrospirota bacterium]